MTSTSDSSELISVIIPTYRGDRFIHDALACVAAQTWPHWEIVVVEDGSAGETRSHVLEFARQHAHRRIEYFHHKINQGQAAARNTAMGLAQGKWLAFLDVDDRWQHDHLLAAIAEANAKQADLAYSTVITFDDETELITGTWGPKQKDLQSFPFSLLQQSFITPSSVVLRRSLVERIGQFDPSFCPCEDLDYWIRAVLAGARFVHVKGCHVSYRKNHSEAQTRGTCRMTEAFAAVVDRHQRAFPDSPFDLTRKAAYMYFCAAWCHATTSRELDPTADPSRAQSLLQKAWELNRRKAKYWLHGVLLAACDRLQSNFLRTRFIRLFQPKNFIRIGQLLGES